MQLLALQPLQLHVHTTIMLLLLLSSNGAGDGCRKCIHS
jgi:hypothetical protein